MEGSPVHQQDEPVADAPAVVDRDSAEDYAQVSVVRGKRTKRARVHPALPAASSSSGDLSGSLTEEEEDMANCLIMLARGPGLRDAPAAARRRDGAPRPHVYECKTCGKCFPSFQALGGHRTSHKKPKTSPARGAREERPRAAEDQGLLLMSIAPSRTAPAGRPRMHECSICGSEFTSGQALGGHMRRHRPLAPPAAGAPEETRTERAALSLDLNLPAPEDEQHVFALDDKPKATPTLLPALVDCHY